MKLILGIVIAALGVALGVLAISHTNLITASYIAMLVGLAMIYMAIKENNRS